MEGAAAVEKKAFVFFALCSALRERRCTPRVVIMVNDVDDEVGEQARRSTVPVFPRIKFLFALSFTSAVPTCSESLSSPILLAGVFHSLFYDIHNLFSALCLT